MRNATPARQTVLVLGWTRSWADSVARWPKSRPGSAASTQRRLHRAGEPPRRSVHHPSASARLARRTRFFHVRQADQPPHADRPPPRRAWSSCWSRPGWAQRNRSNSDWAYRHRLPDSCFQTRCPLARGFCRQCQRQFRARAGARPHTGRKNHSPPPAPETAQAQRSRAARSSAPRGLQSPSPPSSCRCIRAGHFRRHRHSSCARAHRLQAEAATTCGRRLVHQAPRQWPHAPPPERPPTARRCVRQKWRYRAWGERGLPASADRA